MLLETLETLEFCKLIAFSQALREIQVTALYWIKQTRHAVDLARRLILQQLV